MSEVNAVGYELDWDSQIENDSPEYVTLPEGDYPFEVVGFERSRYQPGEKSKLPPCNMAVLTLKFTGNEGTTSIKHKLFLHSSVEGLLCAFFTAIGHRKHGERITMNWNNVLHAKGVAHLKIREYTDKNNNKRTINEVDRFLEPEVGYVNTQQNNPPTNTGYQPGRF